MLIRFVTHSHVITDGEDLGPSGSPAHQAHFADSYIRKRGIFAIAGAHLTADTAEPAPRA